MAKINQLFIVFLCVFSFSVHAQDGNCEGTQPKKAKKQFEKALEGYNPTNSDAVKTVKEILDKFPNFVEGHYFLGNHYEKVGFKTPGHLPIRKKLMDQSLDFYQNVERICPSFSGHLAYYKLGVLYHKEYKQEEKAASYFKKYIDNEKEPPKEYYRVAKELADRYYLKYELIKNPVPYEPQAVKGVNSDKDEFLPMLSPDNEQLYFTRRMKWSPKKAGAINVEEKKEFFVRSKKMDVDSFSFGIPLAAPFNEFEEYVDYQRVLGLGGACLTPDNKEMYLTISFNDPEKGPKHRNTQLYSSILKDGSWSSFKSLGDHINDENKEPTWEGQPTISSDGKMMIFASARPSSTSIEFDGVTISTMDLFYVTKLDNGKWSAPKSLGPVINTNRNEKTPFLHTDSKTLYFASDGHPGMGGYDLFFTRMDENGNWSKPVNLGYPINSEIDNHGLIVSLDGKQAFMSAGKEGDGVKGLDLIHFPLHEAVRPDNVVFMKGVLKDENGKPVADGKIQIKDEVTGEIKEAMVDGKTGEYVAVMSVPNPKRPEPPKAMITLDLDGEEVEAEYGSKVEPVNGKPTIIPPGAKVVELKGTQHVLAKGDKIVKVNGDSTIVKKGYEVVDAGGKQEVVSVAAAQETKQKFVLSATGKDMAFTTQVTEVNPKEIDGVVKIKNNTIDIQSAKKGQIIRLNDVNFATNSFLLNSTTMSIIDELKAYLQAKPTMKIAIYGHTDNVGNANDNVVLSQNRAKEVMEYLISQGIDAKRLAYEGFGANKPKASNANEEGRAINRRVEFIILEL